jgi:hypothetical protein
MSDEKAKRQEARVQVTLPPAVLDWWTSKHTDRAKRVTQAISIGYEAQELGITKDIWDGLKDSGVLAKLMQMRLDSSAEITSILLHEFAVALIGNDRLSEISGPDGRWSLVNAAGAMSSWSSSIGQIEPAVAQEVVEDKKSREIPKPISAPAFSIMTGVGDDDDD